MPTYKTSGIVLRRTNLGEADRIITFLTPSRKLKAVARGVRRIKSRMAGHLELFNEVELMLAQGRNLDIVTSARVSAHHPELANDWQRLSLAYLMAEMVDRLTDEEEVPGGVYHLLKIGLEALNQGSNQRTIEGFFKLRLLDELGYRPELDNCAVCHRALDNGDHGFDAGAGGAVHLGCLAVPSHRLDQAELTVWRGLIAAAAPASDGLPRSLAVLDDFYDYQFGRRFRSRQVLEG